MHRTPINKHKQAGKKLLPPFLARGYTKLSWMHERLPEMLWASLLVGNLPRERAINLFKEALQSFVGLPKTIAVDPTLSGISVFPENLSRRFVSNLANDPDAKETLSAMLLYEDLPGRDLWQSVLPEKPSANSPEFLMQAVGKCLWEQSSESTDCRWMRIMPGIITGRMETPASEFAKLSGYPLEVDSPELRAYVRCDEAQLGMFAQHINRDLKSEMWVESFWNNNLSHSPCFSIPSEGAVNARTGTTKARLDEVYELLCLHAHSTQQSSGIDAQHDTSIGLGLYSLTILRELMVVGNSSSVLGRFGLRSLLEAYVSLAYLTHKSNPDLWKSHRVFGAGQAKLSSLKQEELAARSSFVDPASLLAIANEDYWEEFVPINVGHWEDSSLRRQAVEAGVKADYDKFYAWTSSYIHGHWGPVREAVFETCGNPLHRLHRIPRTEPRVLPDVIPDAVELVDKTLGLISKLYPNFPHRLRDETSPP